MENINFDSSELDAKIAEAYKDDREQTRLFKHKRAGQVLNEGEVRAIKIGRKKLRAELKARGITKKKDFELIASSMGLYFDRNGGLLWFLWFFHGKGLAALLGALAALLGVLFLFSMVTETQGHFTINMSDGMFREGFSLCDEITFAEPSMRLFAEPALDVPCISITDIAPDVDDIDGLHNDATYFAYTFYIRNEGESTVDYDWEVALNSESQDLSKAAWVMIFEDGAMRFYAEPRADGTQEALPAFGDNSRGYLKTPFITDSAAPFAQYDTITQLGNATYYRLIPVNFLSELKVAEGRQEQVAPMDVHKYTVVIWLEGDDPDCTNELIGGHLGLDMKFRLDSEEPAEEKSNWWDIKWDELKFWEEDVTEPTS